MPSDANPSSSKSPGANRELNVQDLLGRVIDRDVQAFESLYDQSAPRLMGLLMRILSARPAAESVLQEVFLRLWKEAPAIAQTRGSVTAWLVLTTRHVALQRLRAQRSSAAAPAQASRRQSRTKEEKLADTMARDSASGERKPGEHPSVPYSPQTLLFLAASPQIWMPRPEDVALVDARAGLLQRAFNQMPKPQRRALELVVFDAYSASEVAAQLGEPLGRVTAGLRAALTFLRHRQHAVLGTWTADI